MRDAPSATHQGWRMYPGRIVFKGIIYGMLGNTNVTAIFQGGLVGIQVIQVKRFYMMCPKRFSVWGEVLRRLCEGITWSSNCSRYT